MITGANSGLGFETARVLADKGARVLMACRSEARANAAMEKIQQQYPQADLQFIALDQGDLGSVKEAAERVAQEPRLDVLINNAGIMTPPYELTKDGFESQFGVNHLGTFALTGLLLDKLAQTPESRIVITSSLAHRNAEIYFDDINAEQGYSAVRRYMQSKLANLLFLYELNQRLLASDSPIMAVACHPGVATTDLSRHLPMLVQKTVVPMLGLLVNNPAQGAWPTLMAATSMQLQGGDYCGPGGFRQISGPAVKVAAAARSRHQENARRLWDLSVEMTGIEPDLASPD